jgi:hypothetical protein
MSPIVDAAVGIVVAEDLPALGKIRRIGFVET